MTWWDTFETLSKLQTALAILVSVLGFITLTVKLRADHLKKQTDARRGTERTRLDKELQDKTAEALRATTALEAKQAPRTITESQRVALSALVKDCPAGTVFVSANLFDGEPVIYARAVLDTLLAANLNVKEYTYSGTSATLGINEPGLIFIVASAAKPPPVATFLLQAFLHAGIPATLMNANQSIALEPDALLIWSSRKP